MLAKKFKIKIISFKTTPVVHNDDGLDIILRNDHNLML